MRLIVDKLLSDSSILCNQYELYIKGLHMSAELNVEAKLKVNDIEYTYYSIKSAAKQVEGEIEKLPRTLKILLENILRNSNGPEQKDAVEKMAEWLKKGTSKHEINYKPARVLMQDFTGVPAVVDLAAMRDAVTRLKGDAKKINPKIPVDLVIDHSVQVDSYASIDSFEDNVKREFERNKERYEFLKWGKEAFENFRVVPPGTGICHQVNLEYLGQVVCAQKSGKNLIAFPDTVVGTDSHTTMINGLAILGWGVGGIEAEAAMLGESISMVIPEVIGFNLTGKLKEGITATDLVLVITEMLRKKGVVGKFVEFYGKGLNSLSLADRATISNMSPEYGATCGFFPIDNETLRYLELTGRGEELISLIEAYSKKQGLWRDEDSPDPVFTDILKLDLSKVEPCIAGPKRPQDRITLTSAKSTFKKYQKEIVGKEKDINKIDQVGHGDIVIAAITSCTNTSNPSVMIAAGLVAKKAVERGMKVKPWVKTSLAPGSQVVSEYLNKSGLQKYLDKIGFNLVGYGCTTCIGNSGPLKEEISQAVKEQKLFVISVLSGNRNFEGRIHPLVKGNYLASPPLVVAYALAGSMNVDITKESLGEDSKGKPVFLKDLWPSNAEIRECVEKSVSRKMFKSRYDDVFSGDQEWKNINIEKKSTYSWNSKSTYIKNPPYFLDMKKDSGELPGIKNAHILCIFGDSITTDHISPAGNIAMDSPAAKYLIDKGIEPRGFNSYGARRGNHEVMMRGTFANIRIRNEMIPKTEGGVTKHYPSKKEMSIYDAAVKYKKEGVPLIVIAGKEYGSGSSRDWAAKGPKLLGVRAVLAESFERIHRSNLIGMGIIPLKFEDGKSRKDFKLTGSETVSIIGLENLSIGQKLEAKIAYINGKVIHAKLELLIYTQAEMKYLKNDGVLSYVIRDLL